MLPAPKSRENKIRNRVLTLGFILFVFGIISLIMEMVGVKFLPLLWMDSLGSTFSFWAKFAMVVLGLSLAVGARSSEDDFDEFFDGNQQNQK